jgi:hypothetical protein
MTNIPTVEANRFVAPKPQNYNAVRIQINNPQTNVPEGYDSEKIGNHSAVDIQVNNPKVNVIPRPVYNYPKADKLVTSDVLYPTSMPKLPVLPVAYQTNLINNRTFVNAEFEFETKNTKTPEKVEAEIVEQAIPAIETEETEAETPIQGLAIVETVLIAEEEPETLNLDLEVKDDLDTPAPNLTTIEAEKELTFKAQPEVEIVPPVEIKPEVDVKAVVSNLSDANYDKQAEQMEDIARIAIENPKNAVPYLVTEIFNELVNISKSDNTELAGPTEKQIQTRRNIIINELVKEEARANGKELKESELPFQLTKEEMLAAAELSPMEQAERNKEYSLYTMAILSKVYVDEIETLTGNVVPLTDLPGASNIVDALRHSENPSIKVAAIDSLRYIARQEYNEELASIFEIASQDEDPIVKRVAQNALENVR